MWTFTAYCWYLQQLLLLHESSFSNTCVFFTCCIVILAKIKDLKSFSKTNHCPPPLLFPPLGRPAPSKRRRNGPEIRQHSRAVRRTRIPVQTVQRWAIIRQQSKPMKLRGARSVGVSVLRSSAESLSCTQRKGGRVQMFFIQMWQAPPPPAASVSVSHFIHMWHTAVKAVLTYSLSVQVLHYSRSAAFKSVRKHTSSHTLFYYMILYGWILLYSILFHLPILVFTYTFKNRKKHHKYNIVGFLFLFYGWWLIWFLHLQKHN